MSFFRVSFIRGSAVHTVSVDNLPFQDEVITESNVQGHLCITKPWPGMARTIYGNHQSFMDVYYNPHPGIYIPVGRCLATKISTAYTGCGRGVAYWKVAQ